jgi:hypothetical protein
MLAMPETVEQWPPTNRPEKLIKMGAGWLGAVAICVGI